MSYVLCLMSCVISGLTLQVTCLLRRIAGDVVMLSHLALKLHYVKQETGELDLEEKTLASRLVSLRYITL
jgi:hypothetical protein